MASTQVQLRKGTTAQHATFTGAAGETTIDTDKDVVVVHDGGTAGGHPGAKAAASSTDNALARFDGTTGGKLQNSKLIVDDDGNASTETLTITPLSDKPSATLRRNNASQTSKILQFQAQDNAPLSHVDKDGQFAGPVAANGFVAQPTTEMPSAVFRRRASNQTSNILEIQDEANAPLVTIDKAGNLALPTGTEVTIGGVALGTGGSFSGDAGDVSVTPVGTLEATDVQAALEELDSEKVAATALGTAAAADVGDFAEAGHAHALGDLSDVGTATPTDKHALIGDGDSFESRALTVGDIPFSAPNKLLGRTTSGAGGGEEITCTAAGRALLDDASAADQLTTLGLSQMGAGTNTYLLGHASGAPAWRTPANARTDLGLGTAALLASTTSVADPGSDSNVPTEQAVREAITAMGGGGGSTVGVDCGSSADTWPADFLALDAGDSTSTWS